MDMVLAALPGWKASLSLFPVVGWKDFSEFIRNKINILATEESLRELVSQLQLIGEVICSQFLRNLLKFEKNLGTYSNNLIPLNAEQ